MGSCVDWSAKYLKVRKVKTWTIAQYGQNMEITSLNYGYFGPLHRISSSFDQTVGERLKKKLGVRCTHDCWGMPWTCIGSSTCCMNENLSIQYICTLKQCWLVPTRHYWSASRENISTALSITSYVVSSCCGGTVGFFWGVVVEEHNTMQWKKKRGILNVLS